MKQKSKIFLKEKGPWVALSFIVPVLIMVGVYASINIYPGSKITLLASDAYSQYANFHASFNNVLHGKQNIFFTWFGSLGLNYWAFMAYYLNGIFTPLVALFDNSQMPDALYFLTLLKIGCSGVSFWVLANYKFNLQNWLKTALSICYALMAYSIGYSEVIMWLDTFVYLPLIILGIHWILDKKSPVLLFISYLLLFLSNFYMAFMVGVFSFLYFFIIVGTDFKKYKGGILRYFITSLLAGGASMVVILPTIIDLNNNGEQMGLMSSFFTPDIGAWDLVAKNLVGMYDTSKFESMPFVYIGLVPLIFCIFYFLAKEIPRKNKLLYGSLGLFLIASFYIQPLNLFWQGFHAPNMFLYRYSFLLSFLVIMLAGYGLEILNKNNYERLLNGTFGLGALFLVFMFVSNKKRYGEITTESLILTIGLLAVYLVLWFYYHSSKKVAKWIPVLLFVVMVGEASFNSKAMVDGIKADWNYPSRIIYSKPYPDIKKLVGVANEENDNLFRLENLDPASLNDSFNFDYAGVTMFSSIRNRHSSEYLNALGFRSIGSNLQVQYANNTLVMDSLLGIKYNIAKGEVDKFGFKKVATKGEYSLYENSYALPLGIRTDAQILNDNVAKNQTELFNYLAETDKQLFTVGEATIIDTDNVQIKDSGDTVTYAEEEPNKAKTITWLVTVPAKTQGYFSLVPTDLKDAQNIDVSFIVDGEIRRTNLRDTGQYFNFGYFEKATTVEVQVAFTGLQKIEMYKPEPVFLNIENFETAIEKIQQKGVDFQTSGRKATATVTSEKEELILTTIPYDAGWTAYIDGKKVEMDTFKRAFLAIPVTAGTHEIELVFLPSGFKIGLILFIGCIGGFVFYCWQIKRRNRREQDEAF